MASEGSVPGAGIQGVVAQLLVESATVSVHTVGRGSERERHKGGPG